MGGISIDGDGTFRLDGGPEDGGDLPEHPLTSHPAVTRHGEGTPSVDLGDFIQVLTDAAKARVQGVGEEQYGNGDGEVVLQKYEQASIDDYVDELLEEVYDIQAYLAIIVLKIIALREKRR